MKLDVNRIKELVLPNDLSRTSCGKNHWKWQKRLRVLKAQHYNLAHAMHIVLGEISRLEARIMEAEQNFSVAKAKYEEGGE